MTIEEERERERERWSERKRKMVTKDMRELKRSKEILLRRVVLC